MPARLATAGARGVCGSGHTAATPSLPHPLILSLPCFQLQVDLDSLNPTVTFICGAKPADKKSGSKKGGN